MKVVYHIGHQRSRKKSTKRQSCKFKKRYYSIETANNKIEELKDTKRAFSYMHAYECKFCTKEVNTNGRARSKDSDTINN